MSGEKLISIIVPVLNEEQAIPIFYEELSKVLSPLESNKNYSFEIIFTDNNSNDDSLKIIKDLAAKDNRIHAYSFSRNFGYQRSIYYGYNMANGNAAIQIDVDLQDPPSMIPLFLECWEQGYEFVYGKRERRKENFFLNLARRIFYRLVNRISDVNIPVDAGEFRLIDRKILDVLKIVQDHQPYLRGLIASVGFRQKAISYNRDSRVNGSSKFNLLQLINFAIDGMASYSVVPLRLLSISGFIIFSCSVVTSVIYVLSSFYFGGKWPAGFTTLALLILINLGVVSLFLGIIGEYLGKTFRQVKREPIAIVREKI